MNSKTLFLISLLFIFHIHCCKAYCNIPKECQVYEITKRQLPTNEKQLICQLNDETQQLRFNKSLIENEESESCQLLNKIEMRDMIIRPRKEGLLKLKKGMIDLKNLIEFTNFNVNLTFQFFNGFEINLFDSISKTPNYNDIIMSCMYCSFDFYSDSGNKLLKSCQDFNETNSTNPRSIFQLFTNIMKGMVVIYLTETKSLMCPLAFKGFQANRFRIYGENSFYSRRVLSFENERFDDLNITIECLELFSANVDLDFNFLHPSVFKSVSRMIIMNKINKIDPDLFHILDNVTAIFMTLEYIRSVMHTNGIEWIRGINKNKNFNLSNISSQVNELFTKVKFICHDAEDRAISPSLRDVFPDEDFCLYKDFPINQLVFIYKVPDNPMEVTQPRKNMGCTYLWMTRSYEVLAQIFPNDEITRFLLNSDEFKSISKCHFDEKLKLCNRSNFDLFKNRHITTFFEIGETIFTIEVVLNISSIILSVLGLVSNILIIITISSKMNQSDFKEFKQYDYLRLNSICNCLILAIHLMSWLNDCIYPFQLFCPLFRKSIFMQYFKIVVQDVLMTALRFMNSFTYIGFAFNRISLIGKDHNKLVKFMCKISIKKYIAISLFISIGFSLIKFFEYDINHGTATSTYPISYDYSISNPYATAPNIAFFILNFVCDLLNHFVLLIVNLAIDIGMIIKLRHTLNERLENVKAYSTTAQQEKKKTDNENVLDNAISMVILNTTLNLILKLPASLYSLIYLWYSIYLHKNVPFLWENVTLERFFKRFCISAKFCGMLLQLSDFLYLLSISLQFFFYKHYDKKLNSAIKKKFGSKKDIQTGLYSLFNLVNMVTSPNIADEKLESKIKEAINKK